MKRWRDWRGVWHGLAARERRLVAAAAMVLALALLWLVGVSPALRTLRTAPAQLDALDRQLQSMQDLAAQARGLQGRPPLTRDDAVRAFEAAVQQRLGAGAQVSVNGDRVTVTLKAASPDLLAQWLGQARLGARAVAAQARLTRGAGGWDGTIVFDLPPAP